MLDDRPPDVRMMRPGGDKQVTPLEEVAIEARADDDFGRRPRSSWCSRCRAEGDGRAVPAARGGLTVSGQHLMSARGSRREARRLRHLLRAGPRRRPRQAATESRSDIFFLEVKPFEEEFVAAQSQAMGMRRRQPAVDDLADAQKDIIVAHLEAGRRARRRRRGAVGGRHQDGRRGAVASCARARRAAGAAAQVLADPRRRRGRPGAVRRPGGDEPMARGGRGDGPRRRRARRS